VEVSAAVRTLLACLVLLLALPAHAAVRSLDAWELGLMLGSPTGLTLKKWLGGGSAFDVAVGGGPGLRFHGDYLLAIAEPVQSRDVSLDLYLGGGAVVGTGDGFCTYYRSRGYCDGSAYFGGRVPLGLDVRLQKAPVALGLELAPGVIIGRPGADLLLDVFLYVRFVLGH
jgi:hypothetical protein